MKTVATRLPGPVLLAPAVHSDERGFFLESFRESLLPELGVPDHFVQDNHSRSRRGTVRGMHYQAGQAKLIRCVRGSILDVIVDIRHGSPHFGQWEAFQLDDSGHLQLYCPDGFAHGFCVLSDLADVAYKISDYYSSELEGGFAYDDPEVAVQWPADLELIVSERDRTAPTLAQRAPSLPFVYADGHA